MTRATEISRELSLGPRTQYGRPSALHTQLELAKGWRPPCPSDFHRQWLRAEISKAEEDMSPLSSEGTEKEKKKRMKKLVCDVFQSVGVKCHGAKTEEEEEG